MPERSNDLAPPADPVPPPVRGILALFADELEGVRFGDLDAAALEALAEQARSCAAAVELARAALEAAEVRLAQAREELASRAQQGLGYARVYAAGDEALRARVGALENAPEVLASEPRPRRSAQPKRPKKASAAELPFEARAGAA